MYFRAFKDMPIFFGAEAHQFKFERVIASCFRRFPRYGVVNREDYPVALRDSVFLCFRVLIRKDNSLTESLEAGIEAVTDRLNEYIELAAESPELFEMSLSESLSIAGGKGGLR